MAINNTVRVTIKIRNDISTEWSKVANNPILAQGEFGLETDTLLLKVGDGVKTWNQLPYLNKLNGNHFIQSADGTISFTNEFSALLSNALIAAQDANNGRTIDATSGSIRIDYGTDSLNHPKVPDAGDDLAIVNKYYVDKAIAAAGHLKREIVDTIPMVMDADPNTIYMILDTTSSGADKYKEYMLIGSTVTQIGDTSVDLTNLVSGTVTAGHLVSIDSNGYLVDAGIAANNVNQLQIATTTVLGGVKSGDGTDDKVVVDNSGFMTLSHVSTSTLYVPQGDTLILNGGNAG